MLKWLKLLFSSILLADIQEVINLLPFLELWKSSSFSPDRTMIDWGNWGWLRFAFLTQQQRTCKKRKVCNNGILRHNSYQFYHIFTIRGLTLHNKEASEVPQGWKDRAEKQTMLFHRNCRDFKGSPLTGWFFFALEQHKCYVWFSPNYKIGRESVWSITAGCEQVIRSEPELLTVCSALNQIYKQGSKALFNAHKTVTKPLLIFFTSLAEKLQITKT